MHILARAHTQQCTHTHTPYLCVFWVYACVRILGRIWNARTYSAFRDTFPDATEGLLHEGAYQAHVLYSVSAHSSIFSILTTSDFVSHVGQSK